MVKDEWAIASAMYPTLWLTKEYYHKIDASYGTSFVMVICLHITSDKIASSALRNETEASSVELTNIQWKHRPSHLLKGFPRGIYNWVNKILLRQGNFWPPPCILIDINIYFLLSFTYLFIVYFNVLMTILKLNLPLCYM